MYAVLRSVRGSTKHHCKCKMYYEMNNKLFKYLLNIN